MAAFKVLETQFQMFIKSRIYLDDEYVVMTRNYFLQYTQLEIPEFCDILIQHVESITEGKVDTSKALDASLVDTESSGTESKEQDTSSRSGNDAHADDADIRPIYDEEPMAEVQTTAEINVFATRQQHTEQPEFNNEGAVDQNTKQFVRQPTASKSERPKTSKPRFASQVDVNNDLSKPVTTHYLPKERESVVAKPYHVIASSKYRNSSKNMPRFSSNDMVHNHYLKEAKKKTQDEGKIFDSSTNKVDSEPPNGSNENITNPYECEQTLNGFKEFKSNKQAVTSDHNSSELGIHDHINEPSSSKLVSKVVPPADKTATSRQELELLFHHHITMLSSQAVNKSPTHYPLPEHPSDTYVFTVKMEILLEPTSNKLLVGTNDDVAASFQQSRIHYHTLMLKLQRHTISIKIQESRKLKY
ncbi:hypothetical protein Tco_1159254 [Tanacetum coccineum]